MYCIFQDREEKLKIRSKAYIECKLSRADWHSARVHECDDVIDGVHLKNPFASDWTRPVVSQGSSHHRIALTSHLKGWDLAKTEFTLLQSSKLRRKMFVLNVNSLVMGQKFVNSQLWMLPGSRIPGSSLYPFPVESSRFLAWSKPVQSLWKCRHFLLSQLEN